MSTEEARKRGVAGPEGCGEDSIRWTPATREDYPNHMILSGVRDWVNTENLTGLEALVGKTFNFLTPAAEMGSTPTAAAAGPWPCSGGGNKIMGKLRFLLALWLGSCRFPALKVTRHNGTDFPGSLALKLCPDFLRYVGKPGTIYRRHRHQRQDHRQQSADGYSGGGREEGPQPTARLQHHLGISTALLRGCDLLGRAKS